MKPGRARPDFLVPGGPGGLGPTQGQFLAPIFKIYVKIMYCEHFLFFEIFWLLVIFETLFSEKCQFLGNFDKYLFLPPSSTQISKSGSNFNLKLFLEHVLSICVNNGGKNRYLSKLLKNGHFSLNKVSKITNNQKI